MPTKQTLEIAQKLYEKKLITYPRTGSRYIPEDVFAEIPKLLAFIGTQPEWKDKVRAKAIPMMNADIITGVSLFLLFVSCGISQGFTTVVLAHITMISASVLAAHCASAKLSPTKSAISCISPDW